MFKNDFKSGLLAGWATLLCVIVSPVTKSWAEEPIQEFLTELRAGYHFDVALEYLDQLQTSPLAPDSFKQRIPLEKAEILILSVNRTRDPRERESLLNQAQATLEGFLKTSPTAELRSTAERTRASLLIARAGMLVEKTKNERATSEQKKQYQEKARGFLESAKTSFQENREVLRKEIVALGKPSDPAKKIELKNLQNEYVRVRRMYPSIMEKIADTYDDNDPSRKKLLEDAASEFEDLYEKYSSMKGGLDSALYAARCRLKLEQYDQALTLLVVNIFSQENDPAFYEIKKQAAKIALSCWEKQEPFPHNDVVAYLAPILQSIKPSEKRQPDWLRLQLGFARACKLKSDQIRADRPKDQDERKLMTELEDTAIDLTRQVSKIPSPFRTAARELLVQWNKKVGDVAENKEPPKTLAEARDRGRSLIADIEDLSNQIKLAQSQLGDESSDKTGLQQQISSLQTELNEKSNQALQFFELALELADETTPIDDISYVRYLQSYCYYQLGMHLETTVIGTFLMNNYPNGAGAKKAMALVCQSSWQLYQSADEENREHELQQLSSNCDQVIEKWPGTAEADVAAQRMTVISLTSNNFPLAEKYFVMITEGSPARDSLMLSMGRGTWQSYIRAQKAGVDREECKKIRDRAKNYLQAGLTGLELGSLSAFKARSVLSLIELYLDEGNVESALQQLEKAKIAPLDLVKQKHPAASDPNYRLDTYRAAIRAYLSALQTGENTQDWIEKAQNVIDALANEFENQPDGKKKMVSVYYKLANELKRQFDAIEDDSKRKSFAQGLDVFLSGVANNATDRQVLIWCGATMSDVGAELVKSGASGEGRTLFEKAISVFDRVGSSSNDLDSVVKLEMQRRKAMAYRGMGQFEKAISIFEEIMTDPANRRYMDLQIEATETFQLWAEKAKDPKIYVKAVMGGIKIKDPKTGRNKNTVLGWQAITSSVARQRNKELIYPAVYNLAKCKYEYGKLTSKSEYIDSAKKHLAQFQKSYPDLGGDIWKPRFEALMREME